MAAAITEEAVQKTVYEALPQFGVDDVPTIAAFVLARLGIPTPG